MFPRFGSFPNDIFPKKILGTGRRRGPHTTFCDQMLPRRYFEPNEFVSPALIDRPSRVANSAGSNNRSPMSAVNNIADNSTPNRMVGKKPQHAYKAMLTPHTTVV